MALSSPTPLPTSTSPTQPADLLLVDASSDANSYAAALRSNYRVATTTSLDVAKQFLHRHPPALVVTELNLQGADGVEICREAKNLSQPTPVLVTTSDAERVPDALAAGCNGVLLKPFAPNLLFARIGRLLRARSEMLRTQSRHQQLKATHLVDRSDELQAGTISVLPNTHCPNCNPGAAAHFEFCRSSDRSTRW